MSIGQFIAVHAIFYLSRGVLILLFHGFYSDGWATDDRLSPQQTNTKTTYSITNSQALALSILSGSQTRLT